MFNWLSSIVSTFTTRRKYYLFVFIANWVVFGLINIISTASSFPELAQSYPLGTVFIWSMLVTTFLVYRGKQLFLWNMIPIVLYTGYALLDAGYETEESETHMVEGGWDLSLNMVIAGIVGFFVFSIVMQLISFLKNRNERVAEEVTVPQIESDDDVDEEEDVDTEDYSSNNPYTPVSSDDPRWR
ncbi:hypothetical protein [Paenibacillus hubeiensis]|uniref:hypothetical protein n=1 Tax=Paenibacillus hubeiensis TaxID=3077330 RepID=UPI0031BAC9CB